MLNTVRYLLVYICPLAPRSICLLMQLPWGTYSALCSHYLYSKSELGRLTKKETFCPRKPGWAALMQQVHAARARGTPESKASCFRHTLLWLIFCVQRSAMADLQSAQEELVARDLFGGALVMGMPGRFVDVSDFRPVPDNQEVCFTEQINVDNLCSFLPMAAPTSGSAGIHRRKRGPVLHRGSAGTLCLCC